MRKFTGGTPVLFSNICSSDIFYAFFCLLLLMIVNIHIVFVSAYPYNHAEILPSKFI